MTMNHSRFLIALAATALFAGAVNAQARDPAYAAARAAGQIGEQPDGYLGVVGEGTPAIRALVNSINISRKSVYTASASGGSTIEQFAFVSGCNLIAKTVPGEKYKTPAGEWKTRTSAPPERDQRCV
ncbi:MAG: YdbL family protein [Pseudomonadota bacterium]